MGTLLKNTPKNVTKDVSICTEKENLCSSHYNIISGVSIYNKKTVKNNNNNSLYFH